MALLSVSLCWDTAAPTEIDQIVSISRSRNRTAEVTGALIFTGAHFAQYLEGPGDELNSIRHSIASDARHADIRTIREGDLKARRFERWSLAYASSSPAFDRLVALAHRSTRQAGELLLLEMMRRFTDSTGETTAIVE